MKTTITFLLFVMSSSIFSQTLSDSLQACYPFSGNADDVTIQDHHGVAYGPLLSADRFNDVDKAYYFDGIDDYIEIPHSSDFNLLSAFSISAWIHLDQDFNTTGGITHTIIEKGSSAEGWEWTLSVNNDTTVQFEIHNPAGTAEYMLLNSNMQLTTNEWHHVVAVFDDQNVSAIYIDGVENGITTFFDLANSYGPGTSPVNIGARKGWASHPDPAHLFKGKIDDVKLYKRVLTPCDVSQLYNVTNSTAILPSSEFHLSEIDGSNGFVILGASGNDYSSWSLSGLGDVNADGMNDIAVCATGANVSTSFDAGKTYIIYGSNNFPDTIELASLDGSNGFAIHGIHSQDRSGYSVSGLQDINADGIDDMLIGAIGIDGNYSFWDGGAYVVYGNASFSSPTFDLSNLNGTNGFFIEGIDSSGGFGWAVSGLGDINNDGMNDMMVSASNANIDSLNINDIGKTYVIFGNSIFPSSFDLNALDGNNGFVVVGRDNSDHSGTSVSHLGDVNADGIDDLILSAYSAGPVGMNDPGESYVIFGSNIPFDAVFYLDSLNGTNGFVIVGANNKDYSGWSISGLGDVNGDGWDDILIGAPGQGLGGNNLPGKTYVVFGTDSFPQTISLATLNGSDGFVMNGIYNKDLSGVSVSGLGDVNNDGLPDILIGASEADPNGKTDAGEAYVVYGDNSFPHPFNLSDLNGYNGFKINGIDSEDWAGFSVSGLDDVNDDGIADILIGALQAAPHNKNRAGESYVIFGRSQSGGLEHSIAFDTTYICQGDSVFLEGAFQYTAGIYYDTLQNFMGCDSIVQTTVLMDTCFHIQIKAFLRGPYNSALGLMIDEIRMNPNQLLPDTTPYDNIELVSGIYSFPIYGSGGGEVVSDTSVYSVSGNNAIVDWMYIQIRDGNDSTVVIESKSALIQRDGDIVDIDGVSPIRFVNTNLIEGNDYFIAINHRNHLGIMTANVYSFNIEDTIVVDFTDPNTPVYNNASHTSQLQIGSVMTMYPGDVNADGEIRATGPCNPINCINDFQNISARLGSQHFVLDVYELYDITMDADTRRVGPCLINNCINDFQFLMSIISSPVNVFKEQIP